MPIIGPILSAIAEPAWELVQKLAGLVAAYGKGRSDGRAAEVARETAAVAKIQENAHEADIAVAGADAAELGRLRNKWTR